MLACDTDALSEKEVAALADAAVAWSRAWADRQGAPLLLLDDFDRLDPDARAFVRRLVLHPHAPPARWVWARRGSAAGAPEDERLLLEAGVADAMELSPLGEPDLARLAAARLGQPAPAALVEFLWSGCRGHPGLAIELLRAAAAAGALREDDTGLIVAADELSQIRAPASFRTALIGDFLDVARGVTRLLAHDLIALPRSKGDQMWRRNVVRAALRLRHSGRAGVRGLSGDDLRTSGGKQSAEDDRRPSHDV